MTKGLEYGCPRLVVGWVGHALGEGWRLTYRAQAGKVH